MFIPVVPKSHGLEMVEHLIRRGTAGRGPAFNALAPAEESIVR